MAKQGVDVTVAGQKYRLMTDVEPQAIQRLASIVEGRLLALAPGQKLHPQVWLLVALGLAQDLEEEKAAREAQVASSRQALRSMLQRVERALGPSEPGAVGTADSEDGGAAARSDS